MLPTLAFASPMLPLPIPCSPDQAVIEGTLNTNQNVEMILSLQTTVETTDNTIDVQPGNFSIKIRSFTDQIRHITLKPQQSNISNLILNCPGFPKFNLSPFEDRIYRYKVTTLENYSLYMMDLGSSEQKIDIIYKTKNNVLLKKDTIELANSRILKTLLLNPPKDAFYIDLKGENRFATWLFDSKNLPLNFQSQIEETTPDDSLTYFLVAPRGVNGEPEDEMFTIATDDVAIIKKAQEQIQNPSLEKIIVAGIKKGTNSFNRDWQSPNKTPFSWFVNRIDSFADFAHISCDGSPNQVEEHLNAHINTGGRICFWRYRIIRELSRSEVAKGKLNN